MLVINPRIVFRVITILLHTCDIRWEMVHCLCVCVCAMSWFLFRFFPRVFSSLPKIQEVRFLPLGCFLGCGRPLLPKCFLWPPALVMYMYLFPFCLLSSVMLNFFVSVVLIVVLYSRPSSIDVTVCIRELRSCSLHLRGMFLEVHSTCTCTSDVVLVYAVEAVIMMMRI